MNGPSAKSANGKAATRAAHCASFFAWGRGKLWAIGAFVKNNDPQGERFVRRILHRVAEVQ